MNREDEKKNQFEQIEQYQPEDLSLKGYYAIGFLSLIIGFVIVSILNLATPHFLSDRLAYLSQRTGLSTGIGFYLIMIVAPLPGLLLIYFSFRIMLSIILWPLARYLNLITTGRSLPAGLKEKAERRLLNIPFRGNFE